MIELRNVRRRYAMSGQTVHALAGVDLRIGAGEFVAITGPSGSGKSSLLNILGCLDRPSEGQYLIEGRDVASFDDEDSSDMRNRRIGFVFQSFHLLPRLSVLENVLLPLRFHREPPAGTSERALSLLDRVGLADRRDHRPNELSGGQMQRAAIARALLLNPALLLADEPTGNLDSKSAADVLALIDEVHATGQTVIMVTHDQDIAGRAPRQVRLHDGLVEYDGVPRAPVH
ncbi:MAG: ABC transporter ATP-binding protein [Luteimonas sp.]